MKIILIALSLLVPLSLYASNPHHKLAVALENGVRSTESGEQLYQQAVARGLNLLLFHCFPADEMPDYCDQEIYIHTGDENIVYFHSDLVSADFEELIEKVREGLQIYVDHQSLRP